MDTICPYGDNICRQSDTICRLTPNFWWKTENNGVGLNKIQLDVSQLMWDDSRDSDWEPEPTISKFREIKNNKIQTPFRWRGEGDISSRCWALCFRFSITPSPRHQSGFFCSVMNPNRRIFRVVNEVGFSQIPNDLLRDKRLSYGARGVMAMILSNKDEWEAHRSYLLKLSDMDKPNRIKGYIKELESLGYAHYCVVGGGKQRFVTVWTFYSIPLPEESRSNKTNWKWSLLSDL